MAIHFEDLNADVQKQIIKDALRSLVHEHFMVRRFYIEPSRPDHPEQCIHAYIDVIKDGGNDVTKQLYALLWDVRYREITRTLKEKKEDPWYKEQLTLLGIAVDYTEGETKIVLNFKTDKDRFGMNLKVEVPENMTEEEKYEICKKVMGKAIFQAAFFDRKYKNGCATDDAMKQVGVMMPDIIEAISKKEPYSITL
jgi:hypothetical protein